MKSIKLGYPVDLGLADAGYTVITVKNSTEYDPGTTLIRSEVDRLCTNTKWDVTIVPLKEQA